MTALALACCALTFTLGMVAYLAADGLGIRAIGGVALTAGYSGAFAQLGPTWSKQSDYTHLVGLVASACALAVALGASLIAIAEDAAPAETAATETRDPYDVWMEQAA